ncbi:uncharacterized protein BP01DRAFT_391421 [Aspergillus saccharolyticus JOP 1030-1]|uniref:Uncharacterized protein n=1 Tax=Aspergillus saccharolyticus JOP 1030-1 TaxID=1450539 RepID=A0A318ZDP9_9EURO|nr:hypothetical protein BP01DRAFT_391421 [Aspergillus saccharolyticus JOP 1030-1]PYH45646.1 hypothetical protein BP01DRAFT_391421 [Aspergillus saccharolyticus JOP 1030-1]
MCGPSRPSTGNLIAIIFPSSSTSSSYSLTFSHDTDLPHGPTKATFRISDPKVREVFQTARAVDLRIEKYGDLTAPAPATAPLHWFRVGMGGGKQDQPEVIEVMLPERLELGVSGTGIVGREVRVSVDGVDEKVAMGRGVVGFD